MSFLRHPAYEAFWIEVARGDLATWIQLTPYVYATLEGIHLVGVALFFGPIVLLDLRLLGLMPRVVVQDISRFLLRIAIPAFALVTISGVLLFVPSADRFATSPVFAVKLIAIAAGAVNAGVLHAAARRRVDVWGSRRARAASVLSVVVWVAVIVLGRWLGYERREPPAVEMNEPLWAAGTDAAGPTTLLVAQPLEKRRFRSNQLVQASRDHRIDPGG